MPYGLPKNLQNKTNEQWMEDCVEGVTSRAKGVNKTGAIKICKKNLINKKGDHTKANIAVINDILELYSENRRNK